MHNPKDNTVTLVLPSQSRESTLLMFVLTYLFFFFNNVRCLSTNIEVSLGFACLKDRFCWLSLVCSDTGNKVFASFSMPIRVREQLLIWREYKRPFSTEKRAFVLLFFVTSCCIILPKKAKKSGVSDRKIRTP